MVHGAKRNPDRCPTHPGALLREDVIPATGKTKAEIAKLLGISRQHLYGHFARAQAGLPGGCGSTRQVVWRRRRGLGPHAGGLRYLARRTRRGCERNSHASSQSRINARTVVATALAVSPQLALRAYPRLLRREKSYS